MRNKKLIVLFVILTIVTLLVVLGSVIFSVQDVYGYCYNDSDDVFMNEVASDSVTGIQRGKSIFLLNEQEIIDSVESKIPDIEVINIERKFPNRVYINFVRIFPYLVLDSAEQDNALLVGNNGKIIEQTYKQTEYDAYIKILTNTKVSSNKVGEYLFEENSIENITILGVLDGIERSELYVNAIDLFEFIDVSYLLNEGKLFVKTRTGAFIEIHKANENTANKINSAMSAYKEGNSYQTDGTIIVDGAGRVSRTNSDRYNNNH